MTKQDKLIARILRGQSDSNLKFDDIRKLLIQLGFIERIRGSHHVFVMPGSDILMNLQRDGRLAKAYQVRQVRESLTTRGLLDKEDA